MAPTETMLTIFTIPKPFKGHINIIQRNAIQSWLQLQPKCEIILFGNEEGTKETAKEFGVLHIPKIKKNEFGIPLVNDIFEKAQKRANYDILVYINTDMILMSDFMKTIEKIKQLRSAFLIIGQRWDLEIKEAIQFTPLEISRRNKDTNPEAQKFLTGFSLADWEKKLYARFTKEGKLHGLSASDYFVFPKDINWNMPPFCVGRTSYDNWFIYRIRSLKIPVIDATEAITTIHQNHKPHKQEDNAFKAMMGRNIKLAGGFSDMCNLLDADWIFTLNKLKRPGFPRIIFSKLSLFYPWRKILAVRRKIRNWGQVPFSHYEKKIS